MEDNLIGTAISYLEERGIDTSNMSTEEIIAMYYKLLDEEKEIPLSDEED